MKISFEHEGIHIEMLYKNGETKVFNLSVADLVYISGVKLSEDDGQRFLVIDKTDASVLSMGMDYRFYKHVLDEAIKFANRRGEG